MRLATQGTRTARPAVPRTISRAEQGPQLQSCEGARPLRAPRLPPRLFRARSLCAGSVEGPGSHTARASPPALPGSGIPTTLWVCPVLAGGWDGGGARGHALDQMGEWGCQGLRSGRDGAVEGTHTGRQAFPQGTSAHSRGSFSGSWFIRGPNSPPPLARGSLADGGEGGAPNLGHSGPALCCLNPSPLRSLVLPAPSPVSTLSHGPPGSC